VALVSLEVGLSSSPPTDRAPVRRPTIAHQCSAFCAGTLHCSLFSLPTNVLEGHVALALAHDRAAIRVEAAPPAAELNDETRGEYEGRVHRWLVFWTPAGVERDLGPIRPAADRNGAPHGQA